MDARSAAVGFACGLAAYPLYQLVKQLRTNDAAPGPVKESTIRLMTRIAMQSGAVNLSQGFPNEAPPRVMALAAAGEIPHSRATGKLLFPRDVVLAWIDNASEAPSPHAPRPPVVLGSHDPLLEWSLRESGSGLAALFDGSMDGLERFEQGEGVAAGLHVVQDEGWNTEAVARRLRFQPVALLQWAWRSRGFIVPADNPKSVSRLADVARLTVVQRQPQAGSQLLLDRLLGEEGIAAGTAGPMARDEREALRGESKVVACRAMAKCCAVMACSSSKTRARSPPRKSATSTR